MAYPFTMDEVNSGEFYPATFPGFPPNPKYATPISPKENFRLVYERKLPVWIPISTDTQMFFPRVDPDNIARHFVYEARPLAPEEESGGLDRHGIEWEYVPSAQGSMVRPGQPTLKTANDWEKVIQFPDVDSWDWAGAAEANKEYIDQNKALYVWILTGFFERLISFMDFADAAVALIDDDQKTAVHGLFAELVKVYKKMVENYAKYFKPDVLSLHDDWGSQINPFFSLDTAMEMIVPYIKQVVDHCHENGIFYDQHSCGKNEKLVPAYIACGTDSWSGQPMNDKQWIYDNYGGKLILGIEAQIPVDPATGFGTMDPDENYAAGKAFVDKYGPDYLTKPVTNASFAMNSKFSEAVYVESRKLFESMR